MKPLDPLQRMNHAELANIVSSHDRLQQWNSSLEAALNAGGDHPAPALLSNIRETASLIIASGRQVSSQNFELMRALNLNDRVLSLPELIEGMGQGAMASVRSRLPEPVVSSDMNLAHSQARVETLEVSTQQKIEAISSAAAWAMDHPGQFAEAVSQVPKKFASDYQRSVAHLQTNMAQTMSNPNSSQSLGLVLGAGMTHVAAEALDPFKKLESVGEVANDLAGVRQHLDKAASLGWEDFAKLGAGTVPGGGRTMRDFSEQFSFYPLPREVYYREGPNFFQSGVSLGGEHSVLIISKDGPNFGYGTELHLSALKVYHNHGIEITSHDGNWPRKPDYTNWQQYDAGIEAGLAPEQAAMNTFSGRMARESGLTRATVTANTEYRILVEFQRPDWGNDGAWNDYANGWVSSMGNRADLSLHQNPPRTDGLFIVPKADVPATTVPPAPPSSKDVPGHNGQRVDGVADASELMTDALEKKLINYIAASDLPAESKAMVIAQVRDNFASAELTPQDHEVT